jgi:hypothetical protein
MPWNVSPCFWVRSAGCPIEWVLAVSEQQDVTARSGPNGPTSQIEAARQAVVDCFRREPSLREAVFLSNRDAFKRIAALLSEAGQGQSKRYRERARLAWAFLQRLCAKNDTVSFFGPISWGTIDEDIPYISVAQSADGWIASRRVFIEHWVIQALADEISADPGIAQHLPVSLHPACRLEGDILHYPVDQQRKIAGPVLAIVAHLAAHRRREENLAAAALAARIQSATDFDGEVIASAVEKLVAAKILSRHLIVPTVSDDAVGWLDDRLACVPQPNARCDIWRSLLGRMRTLAGAIEGAGGQRRIALANELQDEVEGVLGSNMVARPRGSAYAGRYVFYEDCGTTLKFHLGSRLIAEIGPVFESVLNAYRKMAAIVAEELQRAYRAVHATLAVKEDDVVDFVKFYQVARLAPADGARSAVRAAFQRAWSAELNNQGDGDAVIDLAALGRVVEAVEIPPRAEQSCVLANVHSPDILFSAKSLHGFELGDFLAVIGEIHPGVHAVAQPVARPFCPDREAVDRDVERLLAPFSMVLVDPPATYHRSDINWPTTPSLHEIVVPGASSRLPPERQVPAADVAVTNVQGRMFAIDINSGRRCDLLMAMPSLFQRLLFELASDVLGSGYSGRITCGKVVLKRHSWLLANRDLAAVPGSNKDAALACAVRRWAAGAGVPRFAFFKAADEPKPMFIDFDNAAAIELFARTLRRAGSVLISEMLPAPDGVWLSHAQGRLTCEFRTTWTWRP